MTQKIVVTCDGPECEKSVRANTQSVVLAMLDDKQWFTITEHQRIPGTYHFCSAKCVRNAMEERLNG